MLQIELSGAAAGDAAIGLDLRTGEASVVRGLAIGGFGVGVRLAGRDARVEGDFIGLDAAGTEARGNGVGVLVENGVNNTIGGTSADARNVIAASRDDGVRVVGDYAYILGLVLSRGSDGNVIQGNLIGTDASGMLDRGNGGDGVLVATAGGGTAIGGPSAGQGNTLAYNRGAGVSVTGGGYATRLQQFFKQSLNNAILSNRLYANLGLGIDLGGDGPTGNHPGGLDEGLPNGSQNHPTLTAITRTAAGTTVDGTLLSAPGQAYTVQLFADAAGSAQARVLLATVTATTDAAGRADFRTSSPAVLLDGQAITATATDVLGNTSELSPPTTDLADLSVRVLPATSTARPGGRSIEAIVVTNGGPSRATGVRLAGMIVSDGGYSNPPALQGAVVTATTPLGRLTVTFTSQSSQGATTLSGRFIAALGALGPGESATVVLATDFGPTLSPRFYPFVGTFLASSDQGDLDLSNSVASFTVSVPGPAVDLAVTLAGAPTAPVRVGQAFSLAATVSNRGATPATAVVLRVSPAAGLAISTPGLGSVDPSTGDLLIPLGNLAAGASSTVKLSARATLGGSPSVLRATAGAAEPGLTPWNEAHSAPITALPTGPRVIGTPALSASGRGPASVLVRFGEPLSAGWARRRRLYRLTSAGRDGIFGTRDDRRVGIRYVSYDPTTHAVRLSLYRRPTSPLELRVIGTGRSPLKGTSGLAIDGNLDGVPGGDYRGRVV